MRLLSRRAGCGGRPDQVSREGSGPMAASQPHPPPTFSVFLPFFLSYTFFFYTTPLKSPGPGRTHPMVLVCYLRERQSPNAHRGGGQYPWAHQGTFAQKTRPEETHKREHRRAAKVSCMEAGRSSRDAGLGGESVSGMSRG